jgi:hypothetical protein
LQNMLRRDGNVKPSALSNEIRQVISSPGFPSYLAQQLDAVREVGNLAAHATKDEHTGEILPVESEEAEWNLDVIELLFDFYYVQPAKVREKTTAINEKLKKAGRKTIGREQATDEVK